MGERVSSEVRALAEGHPPQGAPSVTEGGGGAPISGPATFPSEPEGVQGVRGVLDSFSAPSIEQGSGRAEADFFVDGNHSKVWLKNS